MRVATVAVAYREKRLIQKHLKHIPNWVEEKVVLVSKKPWNGDELPDDGTADLARAAGAVVIEHDWKTEEEQRNAGQELLIDFDWVIVLDPDEFLDNSNWQNLKNYLDVASSIYNETKAYVVDHQLTYWKNGYVADPPRDYQQLVLVRPEVRFVDKRVVGSSYGVLPVFVHHFSWAKTDEEVWNKISHYAHASDFDIKHWYENVWKTWKPGIKDVHPTTPTTLHQLKRAELPFELDVLGLWP